MSDLKKKPKKKKASLILFVAELVVLLVLVVAIFGYAKINEGLRNIGTAAGHQSVTGSGSVTAAATPAAAEQAVPQAEEAASGAGGAEVMPAESEAPGKEETLENDEAAQVTQAAADVQTTGATTLKGEVVTHVGTADDPNADADAAEENEGVALNENMKGYTNIALVGIDTRDVNQIDYANSDTMIIASINNDTGQIRLVSLYRDTLLNIQDTYSMSLSQGDADEDITGDADDEGEVIYYEDYEEGGDDGYEEYTDDGYDDYEEGGDDGYEEYTGDEEYSGDENWEEYTSSISSSSEGADSAWSDYTSSVTSTYSSWPDDPDSVWSDYSSAPSVTSSDWEPFDSRISSVPEVISELTESDVWSEPDSEVSEYAGNEFYNYSEDGQVANYQLGETTAAGKYDKANAAYANGSTRQLLQMLNKNLDLNIHDIVVVDFSAVAKLVDDIGGIEVWMTYQEVVHMNNYCKETSKVTGLPYEPIEPEQMPREYHLNGVQAVSYARIRYTAGNDMKRTQRQRVVIEKVVFRAKKRGLDAIQGMINDVLPMCKTSFSTAEIIKLATQVFSFEIEKTTGFPFEHIEKNVYVGSKKLDTVVPVTLEDNVKELHEFLFDDSDYECSATVREYSNDISVLSGLTEASREVAKKNSVIGLSGGEADVVK